MSIRYEPDFNTWKVQFDVTSQRMVDACDRIIARFDRIDALLQAILDHLDSKPADVPLHKRGFGVIEDDG
jgi:hypothetical protein